MTTQPATRTTALGRDWRTQAACLGVDPELFFPIAGAGPVDDTQVGAAKRVCRRCPVVAECLAEALARIPYGIAGGLTEDERRIVHRLRRHSDVAAAIAEDDGRGEVAA
jgi:Transcription factor WhiB